MVSSIHTYTSNGKVEEMYTWVTPYVMQTGFLAKNVETENGVCIWKHVTCTVLLNVITLQYRYRNAHALCANIPSFGYLVQKWNRYHMWKQQFFAPEMECM
jgi:hypothetical protein